MLMETDRIAPRSVVAPGFISDSEKRSTRFDLFRQKPFCGGL